MSTVKKTAPVEKKTSHSNAPMLFSQMNYILIVASIIVVVIGFFLMSGSEGDIYDTKRTTIAPIVVTLGFILGIVAIFYRDSKGKEEA
jgi:uncharacterized membrane protein YozB (DUF420 family)